MTSQFHHNANFNSPTSSSIGSMTDYSTRKLLVQLITTMNHAFIDYDFSNVSVHNFYHELDSQSAMTTINNLFLNEMDQMKVNDHFRTDFWASVDECIELDKCDVYSFQPDDDSDINSGKLWVTYYFFFNKKLKKIVFLEAHAVSKLHRERTDECIDSELIEGNSADNDIWQRQYNKQRYAASTSTSDDDSSDDDEYDAKRKNKNTLDDFEETFDVPSHTAPPSSYLQQQQQQQRSTAINSNAQKLYSDSPFLQSTLSPALIALGVSGNNVESSSSSATPHMPSSTSSDSFVLDNDGNLREVTVQQHHDTNKSNGKSLLNNNPPPHNNKSTRRNANINEK
jgi:hypothetical protein